MMEWRMVFRDPSDQGEKRHVQTPPPHILEKNVQNFLQRWENAEYNGQKLLSTAALKEIAKIRVHFGKGCLSGISPGRGTNRNENLHKGLNQVMSCSKYGVELAYSLLTVIFYNHNERMTENKQPIEYYLSQAPLLDTQERFGLKFENGKNDSGCTSDDSFTPLKLMTCTYAQLYKRIIHTPLPGSGHSKQPNTFVDDEVDNDSDGTDSEVEHATQLDMKQPISISTLKQVLIRALSWFFIHKSLQSVSNTANLRLDQIPFMISTLGDNMSTSILFVDEEEKESMERLDLLLKSWGVSRLEVSRDGNCLFYAVAHNLRFQLEGGNVDLENILNGLGIYSHHSLIEIASALRQGVVKEWTGSNSKEYQKFITGGQLQAQAEEFQQEGVYSIDIGDLVIAALSNLLQSPLVLFTSRLNQPLHIQYPTYSPMVSPNPIYLAYLQVGSGHYDAVVQGSEDQCSDSHVGAVHPGCNCGRKSTFKGNACSFSLNRYSSRCPCYNEKRPCSHFCKCKGCTNSFGTKSTMVPPTCGQKRKRVAFDNQAVPLKGKRTMKFMETVGEPILIGNLSRMEFLVFCSIVQNLMQDNNFDWTILRDLDRSDVYAMYEGILELTETLRLELAILHSDIEKLFSSTSFLSGMYFAEKT